MEIIIHGTKGGRKIFTPKKISGLLDVSSDTAKVAAIGQEAFGIRFTSDIMVFSKYKIIRDVRGDKRIGFVGFSLALPKNRRLSGKDIFTILENVSKEYCNAYIIENNLNDITEKWDFLERILSGFNDFEADFETIQSGDKADTFIYFKDFNELQNYFDNPFQEEYIPFRQVLFVKHDLKGKPENSLNALRHSETDLTGKIDLENIFYKLNEFQGNNIKGVEIKIKNSKDRELRYNDRIYRKEEITIIYSKKYHYDKRIVGSLLNNEELRNYLVVSDKNKIDIRKEIILEVETKTFEFVVTKENGEKIINSEIQINNNPWKIVQNYTFTGEDIGREHTITARKGDNLFSKAIKITPKDYSGTIIPFSLQLIEKRVVRITAKDQDNGDAIWQFKVHITGTNFHKVTDQIEFIGDSIYKEWNIQIEKPLEYLDSENKKFCPANDGNEINFNLKKIKQPQIESNNLGKSGSNSHVKVGKQKSFTTKLRTFFSKPSVIASSVISILALSVGIWVLNNFKGNDELPSVNSLTSNQIIAYIEGSELNLDTLNKYKQTWKSEEHNSITNYQVGLFGGKAKADSSKWISNWKPTDESIDLAIMKRKLLESLNFAELKNQQYSPAQKTFVDAINKIDSTKYKEVGQKLGDVSAFTLVQIAEQINTILKSKEQVKELTFQGQQEYKPEQKIERSEKIEQSVAQPTEQGQKALPSNKTSEIIQYINGSELDEAKLKEYKNTKGINSNLKSSIQLCLDFWNLDGSGTDKNSKTYWNFRAKVIANGNFNNSKLLAFLNQMCQEGVSPSYSKQDKKKGLK